MAQTDAISSISCDLALRFSELNPCTAGRRACLCRRRRLSTFRPTVRFTYQPIETWHCLICSLQSDKLAINAVRLFSSVRRTRRKLSGIIFLYRISCSYHTDVFASCWNTSPRRDINSTRWYRPTALPWSMFADRSTDWSESVLNIYCTTMS